MGFSHENLKESLQKTITALLTLASPWTTCFRRETRWSDGRQETALKRSIPWFFQPKLLFQCLCENSHSAHRLCVTTAIDHDITLSPLLIHVQSRRINLLIIVLYVTVVNPWCCWEAITGKSHLPGSWAAFNVKCQDFFSLCSLYPQFQSYFLPSKKNHAFLWTIPFPAEAPIITSVSSYIFPRTSVISFQKASVKKMVLAIAIKTQLLNPVVCRAKMHMQFGRCPVMSCQLQAFTS